MLSIFLLWGSNKVKGSQKEVLVFIALMLPCIIAGGRATSIGTDVRGYLQPMFDAATSTNSFGEYINYAWSSNAWRIRFVYEQEIGFTLLVWIVGKLTHNIHVVMFAIEAVTIVPFYYAIKRIVQKREIWLGMLIYYFFFYNLSFNVMRQCIAMSFLFLGVTYYFKKDYKKYFVFQVVAFLFHKSSLIGILIVLCEKFIASPKNTEKVARKNMIIVIVTSIIVVLGMNRLLYLLTLVGLGKYGGYLRGNLHFLPNQIISRAPIALMFIFNWKKLKQNPINYFYFAMIIVSMVVAQLASVNEFSGRIASYFMLFYVYSFIEVSRIKYKGTQMNTVIGICYAGFYWWFYFVLLGVAETVPYIWG
jgi:hypothetical protein